MNFYNLLFVTLKRTTTSLMQNYFHQGFCDLGEQRSINCSNPYILTGSESEALSEETISWIISSMPLGAILGSLTAALLLKTIGR